MKIKNTNRISTMLEIDYRMKSYGIFSKYFINMVIICQDILSPQGGEVISSQIAHAQAQPTHPILSLLTRYLIVPCHK